LLIPASSFPPPPPRRDPVLLFWLQSGHHNNPPPVEGLGSFFSLGSSTQHETPHSLLTRGRYRVVSYFPSYRAVIPCLPFSTCSRRGPVSFPGPRSRRQGLKQSQGSLFPGRPLPSLICIPSALFPLFFRYERARGTCALPGSTCLRGPILFSFGQQWSNLFHGPLSSWMPLLPLHSCGKW